MDFLSFSVSEPSQSVETTLWWLTWWPTWRWTRWQTKRRDDIVMATGVDKMAMEVVDMIVEIADMVADM